MSDIAVEIAGEVEDAVLMRQVCGRVHGDGPVREFLAVTDEYAVIVDRILVIHRNQQFAVEPVYAARVRHQAIAYGLPVRQLSDRSLEFFWGHSISGIVVPAESGFWGLCGF